MFEKVLSAVFAVIFFDSFQSLSTTDPILNKKRRLERRIIVAGLTCAAALIVGILVAPEAMPATTSPATVVATLRQWIELGTLLVAGLALLVTAWQIVQYLRFRREYGFD